MAHQFLKFRVQICDSDKDWQPIYASQDYGTFFVVYIKFTEVIENPDSLPGNFEASYKCEFKVQNFRGPVSIGLNGISELYTKVDDDHFGVFVKIKLKAFHFKEEFTPEELPPPYMFTSKINRDKLLKTIVIMDLPDGMYDKNNPISSNYLFPYKYERDGDTALELGRRPAGTDGMFE